MPKEDIIRKLCKSYHLEGTDNYPAQILIQTIALETVRIEEYEFYLKDRFEKNKQGIRKICKAVEDATEKLKKQRNENLKLLFTFCLGREPDMMGKQKRGYRDIMLKSRKLETLQEIEKIIEDDEQIQSKAEQPQPASGEVDTKPTPQEGEA